MRFSTTRLLTASATLALVANLAPASAQTSSPSVPAAKAEAGIQEIVVTANRVESTAQKTAVALTAYTGADLAAKGVTNVQALAAIDPSLNVVSTTGNAYVALRGIASTDVTEIGDPAVPISRDGFFTNRGYSIQATMYDLARVEVLKGPQGTLNGRNSTGGLVSVITQRPEFRNGGHVDMSVGNYGAFHGEGAVNLALSDTFAIRASGVYDYHKGYRTVTGIYTGDIEHGDDSNVASGRVQLAWNPTADIKLWASYQHDEVRGVGDVEMFTTLGVVPTITQAKTFDNGAPTYVNLNEDRIRWEVRHDNLPGGIRFIYSGGYDTATWLHALDGGPLVAGGYPALEQFRQSEHPRTWNHEVRFSNDPHSKLFVQVGWFHFLENNAVDSGLYNDVMVGPFAAGGPLAALSQAGQYGIHFAYPTVRAKSDAVFGYVTYALNDQFKLSAGVRETWDQKVRVGTSTINLAALVSPFIPAAANPPPSDGGGNDKESQATFHVGLDYTPSAHSLIYAKFDTGYKAGGFNTAGGGPSVTYKPEKVATAEIGTKNRFLDNRLQFNLDAFYTRYSDYQGSEFNSAVAGGLGVFNVGSANIYGAELQMIALFGEGGRFDFNATALHTAFASGTHAVDGGGVDQVVAGNRLPNAPGISFTTGLEQALAAPGGKVIARIEGKYSSKFYFGVFNTPDSVSSAYMTGNFSLAYKPDHGGWSVEAYVRNFTNKIVLANGGENYTAGFNTYEFQPPRTFGLRGGVKF